jgi:hypothetical protein
VAARRTLVTVTPAAELGERLSMDPAAATLRLAVLPGSRARADAAEGSDWDIGVLADGTPLLERPSDEFQRFQLEAVQFWCDTETVIRSAHDDVLAALG